MTESKGPGSEPGHGGRDGGSHESAEEREPRDEREQDVEAREGSGWHSTDETEKEEQHVECRQPQRLQDPTPQVEGSEAALELRHDRVYDIFSRMVLQVTQ